MRFNSLLIVAFTFISAVLTLPLPENPRGQILSKRNPEFNDDLAPSLFGRLDDELLAERDIEEVFGRDRQKGKSPKLNPPKFTFSDKARKDLNDLGLHGKERIKAKKYHKKIIKKHMKTVPGAHTAQVGRIAHLGGTTPDDPFHATVAYHKRPAPGEKLKKKDKIASTYKDAGGIERKGGLHHVYPKENKPRLPSSYAAAERKRAGLSPGDPIPHKH